MNKLNDKTILQSNYYETTIVYTTKKRPNPIKALVFFNDRLLF